MLATYLIGLREGLEATLVVSILSQFLVKSQRTDRLKQCGPASGLAVAVSVIFGWLLSYTETTLLKDYRQQGAVRGDHLDRRGRLRHLDDLLDAPGRPGHRRRTAQQAAGRAGRGDRWRSPVMAFLAVVREGLETSLIFYSAVQGADLNGGPLYALIGGIATSIAIGYLMYATAIRINLSRFFTITGVPAHPGRGRHLQVRRARPAGGRRAAGHRHDRLPHGRRARPSSWYTALLSGMFNITPSRPCWRSSPGSRTACRCSCSSSGGRGASRRRRRAAATTRRAVHRRRSTVRSIGEPVRTTRILALVAAAPRRTLAACGGGQVRSHRRGAGGPIAVKATDTAARSRRTR
jgi:high-affinity iron transporter